MLGVGLVYSPHGLQMAIFFLCSYFVSIVCVCPNLSHLSFFFFFFFFFFFLAYESCYFSFLC